ncbi:MAG: DUF3038 domain-containing protein [Synechococcus sp. SB0678_bin_12]|nr:DUF3038 domain-containing protein [Synechococcus sp. SB0678_bin_12]
MAPWLCRFCWRWHGVLIFALLNPERSPINLTAHPHPEPARTVADDKDPKPRLIGRHGLQQLDLLMTTIEALDFRGSEAMVALLRQKNAARGAMDQVELWKWRTTNPLRRTMQRNRLNQAQVTTMVGLVCHMAAHLYPVLHQFISVREDQSLAEARWAGLTRRLQDLVRQRMNPRRAAMQKFADDEHALAMTQQMVRALAFSAGPGGEQRLLASLQDGMRR